MKLSIKFLAITTMICLLSVAGFAQQRDGKSLNPEQRAEKQTTRMIEKLKLNEEQIKTVSAINLTYANKMHALSKKNKEATKEVKTALKAEKSVEMKQVLTTAQFDLYTKMEGKIKGKKGKKGKG